MSITDADRLKYIMENVGFDGFVNVKKDRHEYACDAAEERGRCEPNGEDELEGFRRLIDCSIHGGDK